MAMTQHQTISPSLKILLSIVAILFAFAATILIILSTSAATITGQTPFASISLVHGVNTGILGPGEERWFKFSPGEPGQAEQLEQSLTFMFTPGTATPVRSVRMQIFGENQLLFYYLNTKRMTNLGAGQLVSRDNNPSTGELFWTGWLFGDQSYYVQLENDSSAVIDYWLFTEDVNHLPPDEPQTGSVSAKTTPEAVVEGHTPQTAIPLQLGSNQGYLLSGAERWYSFSLTDADSEYFEELALTMIVTPDNGNRLRNITFDIYTAQAVQSWSPGENIEINNMGAGSIVYRDDNPLTGERFWSGWVVDNEIYYVRIRNGTDIRMDYWLFTGDIHNSNLGESGTTP